MSLNSGYDSSSGVSSETSSQQSLESLRADLRNRLLPQTPPVIGKEERYPNITNIKKYCVIELTQKELAGSSYKEFPQGNVVEDDNGRLLSISEYNPLLTDIYVSKGAQIAEISECLSGRNPQSRKFLRYII